MKLHLGTGGAADAACASWLDVAATATLSELDRPGRGLRPGHAETALLRPLGSSAHERFSAARTELLAARFFPAWFATTHVCGSPTLDVGITVLQRLRVGRLATIEAPVRVVELVDEPERVAVTLVTLDGHPERGIERYDLRLVNDRVTLGVEKAWMLASPLLRIGTPLADVLQRFATRLALRRFRDAAW